MSMPADIEGNRFEFTSRVRKRATELAQGAEQDVPFISGENVVSTAMREIRFLDTIESAAFAR